MESNDKLEQLLQQMYAQESLHDDDIDTSDIIDEEWTKFEAEHFGGERLELKDKRLPFIKIAALFIGVLMLSGITYAAVQIFGSSSQETQEQATEAIVSAKPQNISHELAEQDSTMTKPVVYEDAELATILNDITTFYQVEPVYRNEACKHIRLYFTWDKKQGIDDIINTFNKFERIHITRDNKKLIVE
jgi:hypothetical protein